MPLVTIWRDPKLVNDKMAVQIRNLTQDAVAIYLKVKPRQVEARVRDVGHLDSNYAPIGIEIDTGPGKDGWRVEKRADLSKRVAGMLAADPFFRNLEWFGPDKSYVWLRICESAFTPIGFPEDSR